LVPVARVPGFIAAVLRRSPSPPDWRAAIGRKDHGLNCYQQCGIGTAGGGQDRRTAPTASNRFAVNYLAGFVLTETLLPQLLASAPARVVFGGFRGQMPIDFGNVIAGARL